MTLNQEYAVNYPAVYFAMDICCILNELPTVDA